MTTMAKDPVCGMDVDPANPGGVSTHEGTTYYFCAPGCKQAFDAEPGKYLDPGYVPAGMPEETGAAESEGKRRWWEFWKV